MFPSVNIVSFANFFFFSWQDSVRFPVLLPLHDQLFLNPLLLTRSCVALTFPACALPGPGRSPPQHECVLTWRGSEGPGQRLGGIEGCQGLASVAVSWA